MYMEGIKVSVISLKGSTSSVHCAIIEKNKLCSWLRKKPLKLFKLVAETVFLNQFKVSRYGRVWFHRLNHKISVICISNPALQRLKPIYWILTRFEQQYLFDISKAKFSLQTNFWKWTSSKIHLENVHKWRPTIFDDFQPHYLPCPMVINLQRPILGGHFGPPYLP